MRTATPKIAGHGLKRRAEAFSLAFVLLGGRRAANGYLDTEHPGLACSPRQRADASPLGLIEVARVLRRDALTGMPPEWRA
jgi:hypothetical protein